MHDEMTPRASRADVRNPLSTLPACDGIQKLPPEARQALYALLLDVRTEARERAARCETQNKWWSRTYWLCLAVYALHAARICRPAPAPRLY